MKRENKGGDLFVVDNSVSGWTGLRYLQEWTEIAKSFDIATGFFEIGSFLALDGRWQQLEKIRILMGSDVTAGTKKMFVDAKMRAERTLDQELDRDKDQNPFLAGVPAVVEAIRSGKIECRVYDKAKFHAKAYITHAKLEVVGAKALVGSSNFTRPGLTQNVELNIQVQSPGDVAQLQQWFDDHWQQAVDVSPDLLGVIERHTRLYTPFDVYAKALYEFLRGHEITVSEWEETESQMFPILDRYQQEAYSALVKIAKQHGGAFLCDGVGLGKTFVGLMLIERLVVQERKRVVLFAPKGARDGVWEPHISDYLPAIGGTGGGQEFSNLAIFNHTDLTRKGDFPERFRRVAEFADVVLIDEAHHFRNPGRVGDDEKGVDPSRYARLFELLDTTTHPKTVYLLTATPVNNHLSDFRHMTELFSRRDEAYFAKTLGINNLRAHFNELEKSLRRRIEEEGADAAPADERDPDVGEHQVEADSVLVDSPVFRNLVVQRSRAYAIESQKRQYGKAASFPIRKDPIVAEYSIRKSYGHLLDLVEEAFSKERPLFSLAMYYPLYYYKGPDETIDPFDRGRQRQVVGLIRTQFLKRFESSVIAFELSCNRLMQKLVAFLEVHSESSSERRAWSAGRTRTSRSCITHRTSRRPSSVTRMKTKTTRTSCRRKCWPRWSTFRATSTGSRTSWPRHTLTLMPSSASFAKPRSSKSSTTTSWPNCSAS